MQYDYLTLKEVSEKAHVPYRTLLKHVRAGKLRAYRLAGKLIVKPEDMEAYVWGNPVQPKTKNGGDKHGSRPQA